MTALPSRLVLGFAFCSLTMGFFGMILTVGFGIAMVDPHYGDIEQAEEEKRICEITEGCDVQKAQERIDDWKAKKSETRKSLFPFFVVSSFPMIVGYVCAFFALRIQKRLDGVV